VARYDEAMAAYQSGRDARAMPAYQMTLQIARCSRRTSR